MKKTLITIALLTTMFSSYAQNIVIDFQELLLGSGTDTINKYWNGSDMSGGFSSKDASFYNNYTVSSWGDYWGGFAYSNSTDTITKGSKNYGVYGDSVSNKFGISNGNYNYLNFTKSVKLNSIDLANTSYAALSMKFGDAFVDKFGGESGNVEDSLKVIIKGYINDYPVDSAYFFLADFRFADNSKDYIAKNWHTVDLSHFPAGIEFIGFSFQSSQRSGKWNNTPDYVAIDNINYSIVTGFENELASSKISIYPNPANDKITVAGADIKSVEIVNLNGETVLSSTTSNINISDLASGIYVVKIADNKSNVTTQKLVVE